MFQVVGRLVQRPGTLRHSRHARVFVGAWSHRCEVLGAALSVMRMEPSEVLIFARSGGTGKCDYLVVCDGGRLYPSLGVLT